MEKNRFPGVVDEISREWIALLNQPFLTLKDIIIDVFTDTFTDTLF